MGWVEFYEQAVQGVVDLRMGRAAGLDDTTVRRRAQREEWTLEHAGCWRLPTHPETPLSRLTAAVRRAGPGAVADRHTSFALRGLVAAYPTKHQLLLPHTSRLRRLDGLDVRRTRHLVDGDVEEVEGIPCIVLPRGLLHAARDHTTDGLRRPALAAVRRRELDADDLQVVLDRFPYAAGRRKLQQVVHDVASDGSDSGFEFTTRRRVLAAGLQPDTGQPTVLLGGTRRRIDIAWVALRVGIECQGYRDHAGADALDRDAVRLNQLAGEADWVILQVTPRMLHDGWPAFVADLCACLRRRARALGMPCPPGAELH